jgi:RNA polymerase sigma factor (TIGR02999 family)
MPRPTSASTSQLLQAVQEGDEAALDVLFNRVYDELRSIAHKQRHRVDGDLTLRTTEVVHEVYLKFQQAGDFDWSDRVHFLRVAARAMRQVVIDYARKRSAQKRGGDDETVSMDANTFLKEVIPISDESADALVALDEAIDRLADRQPRQRDVVECRFFGGMTIRETADVLDVSTATVKRDWRAARAWLYKEVKRILGVDE